MQNKIHIDENNDFFLSFYFKETKKNIQLYLLAVNICLVFLANEIGSDALALWYATICTMNSISCYITLTASTNKKKDKKLIYLMFIGMSQTTLIFFFLTKSFTIQSVEQIKNEICNIWWEYVYARASVDDYRIHNKRIKHKRKCIFYHTSWHDIQ